MRVRDYRGPLGVLAAGVLGVSLLCSVSAMAMSDLRNYIRATFVPLNIVDLAVANLNTVVALTEQAVKQFVPTPTITLTASPINTASLTPLPSDTPRQFFTVTPHRTRRPRDSTAAPVAPKTNTPRPAPTNTRVPPTNTPLPPTATSIPLTSTPVPPTVTNPPPTQVPPTDTSPPPTSVPPTQPPPTQPPPTEPPPTLAPAQLPASTEGAPPS